MKYKSYIARIEYDEKDQIFVDHLATTAAAHGKSISQWATHCSTSGRAGQSG